MKHTDWLRLQTDSAALASLRASGENVCAVLRQQNYQCLKQTRRLSWKIITPLSPPRIKASPSTPPLARGAEGVREETGGGYLLTWLPAPVSDWSLIPNETSETREKLWNLAQSTLTTLRGGELKTYQRISQPEDFSRPWAIVRLLPDFRRYTVARFHNRQDAQDHLRFLNRVIPAAKFEVIFDVPSDVEG